MKRKAQAVWRGQGTIGSGTISTPNSGLMKDQPYSAKMRFESEDGRAGTNPEELIAAAHAACFNMALSFQLSGAGFPPDELSTQAVLTMENEGVHWTITAVRLELRGTVPGISAEQFQSLAEAAKATCPVSKVLDAEITLDAQLAS